MKKNPEVEKNMPCRSCGCESNYLQGGELIGIVISYFECPTCGYVQTETPYWLDQAYAETISNCDTGIMARNQNNARIALATLQMMGRLDDTLVDYAGGYGIFVRLLRDYGINALWSDLHCKNLLARGFEYTNESAGLVTAFEAFEHFVNPAEELDKMLAIAPNVLFCTDIIADPAPKVDDWWYYGKAHGQHIGFFRIRTLEKLAKERGKFFVSNGTTHHLISDEPFSHVFWKLIIRLNRLYPSILRRRLVPKIWSDYEIMAKRYD